MFCKECGSKIEDGAEFCPSCGAKTVKVNNTTAADVVSAVSSIKLDKTKFNYLGMAACILGIIAMFLPMTRIEGFMAEQSISFIQTDRAAIMLILFIVAGVLAVLGMKKPFMIVAILVGVFALYVIVSVHLEVSKLEEYFFEVKSGIGYFLYLLAAIMMVAAPFVDKYIPRIKK